MFGTNIHPRSGKLQCEQGALFSYREHQKQLGQTQHLPPAVWIITQIQSFNRPSGAILSEQHLIPRLSLRSTAQELILQVDGGHIPIQEQAKRSFEALAIVYRPQSLQVVDQHHRNYQQIYCSQPWQLETMNSYVLNAAHQQGMNQRTQLSQRCWWWNCWTVIAASPKTQLPEVRIDLGLVSYR